MLAGSSKATAQLLKAFDERAFPRENNSNKFDHKHIRDTNEQVINEKRQ